jgi:hypothetical protein
LKKEITTEKNKPQEIKMKKKKLTKWDMAVLSTQTTKDIIDNYPSGNFSFLTDEELEKIKVPKNKKRKLNE